MYIITTFFEISKLMFGDVSPTVGGMASTIDGSELPAELDEASTGDKWLRLATRDIDGASTLGGVVASSTLRLVSRDTDGASSVDWLAASTLRLVSRDTDGASSVDWVAASSLRLAPRDID